MKKNHILVNLVVRVDPQQKAALSIAAAHRGKKPSVLIREALSKYLDQ